ncbi:unnamed protein product [Dovyalis caffra]|uniref:Uncharacterized protein n=1 Tax=Dovyalis caffra TaxID=77055 RepID=A0AAV1S1T4_9ROSI|nr:unnamed protein product [Dovyalis caffra]
MPSTVVSPPTAPPAPLHYSPSSTSFTLHSLSPCTQKHSTNLHPPPSAIPSPTPQPHYTHPMTTRAKNHIHKLNLTAQLSTTDDLEKS